MGDKKRLARAGLEVMDRLDLPGELAAGVGRMELVGNRQFYMEQHRGVLRYSTEVIDIAAADMTVRITGRELPAAGHDGPGTADQRHHHRH